MVTNREVTANWLVAKYVEPMRATDYEGPYGGSGPQGLTGAEGPRGPENYPEMPKGMNGPAGPILDDKVYQPHHYAKWNIEPITYIMRNGMEFWRGNIIKYASRAGSKSYDGMDAVESEITDLEKVRRYAEMRINQLRGETIL